GRARIDQPTIGGADSIAASVVGECADGGKRDGLARDQAGRSDRKITVCQGGQIAGGTATHGAIDCDSSAGDDRQRTVAPVPCVRNGNVATSTGQRGRAAGGYAAAVGL